MRVNVYGEELTDEVAVVKKQADGHEAPFYGARIYLESPIDLGDNDRSAVTLWIPQGPDGKPETARAWAVLDSMRDALADIDRRADPDWHGDDD